MSLAQGNNTPTRPRIEPGSPDPEPDALTTRPVRSPYLIVVLVISHLGFEGGTLVLIAVPGHRLSFTFYRSRLRLLTVERLLDEFCDENPGQRDF